jgi:hypothetical protein
MSERRLNMSRRKRFTVLGVVILLALTAVAAAWPHAPTPDPFGKYLVYSAAGVYDPDIPATQALPEVAEYGDLATWFHEGVMGRNQEELEAEEAAADAYFEETFGDLYTGDLIAFGVDPRNEYRAYYVSGMRVPSEGWVVRDGGFSTVLMDDGSFAGIAVYGDYNIKVTKQGKGGPQPDPIVIHYQSAEPIVPNADGSLMFLCELSSESFDDFGGGLAQGISASRTVDGYTVANIRNVLTFPGLGFDAP